MLKTAIIGAVANCGVQYNVHVISEALFILKEDKPLEDWMKSLIESAVFVGAVLGMMVMGYLGDKIGRDQAMVVTMTILALGSIGSSVCTWGNKNILYYQMAAFRLLLGIGSGGVYPLYAAKAVEQGGDLDHIGKTLKSAKGFFWRLPGAILVFLLALLLFAAPISSSLQWRILLGLGSVFPLINIWEILFMPQKPNLEFEAAKNNTSQSIFTIIRRRGNCRNLIVTGGCWLLYDAVYYGTSLVQHKRCIWEDWSRSWECLFFADDGISRSASLSLGVRVCVDYWGSAVIVSHGKRREAIRAKPSDQKANEVLPRVLRLLGP